MYFPLLSIGEVFKTALLNTVLGMGTVFAVLIFISLLISLLAYIPKILESFNKKEPKQKTSKSAPATTPISAVQPAASDHPEDDLELIAVITAAIAASTGVPEDAFVVRSIRRSAANHWNKTI
ncbi:MAG: OadG family protein [Lachnospiraceae bacterium]|nr:OadG family protein [Lachnospiraceae bacterium]